MLHAMPKRAGRRFACGAWTADCNSLSSDDGAGFDPAQHRDQDKPRSCQHATKSLLLGGKVDIDSSPATVQQSWPGYR